METPCPPAGPPEGTSAAVWNAGQSVKIYGFKNKRICEWSSFKVGRQLLKGVRIPGGFVPTWAQALALRCTMQAQLLRCEEKRDETAEHLAVRAVA